VPSRLAKTHARFALGSTWASHAATTLAAALSVLCLGACAEPAPNIPVSTGPAQGSFTERVAPVERRDEHEARKEQTKDLVLDGATVTVPGWFESLSADRLEALRLDMGDRDPERQVTIAVMRAPTGQASTVVQISHTAMSAKSGAGAPVRGFLEAQLEAMKKTMVHPNEQILQFGRTPTATSMDFKHTARITKPSGDLIQIHTRGAMYVTTQGRVVSSQVECVAEPTVAEQLCVPVIGSWKLTSASSLSLDAVISPSP
jgi:hypothetical protein